MVVSASQAGNIPVPRYEICQREISYNRRAQGVTYSFSCSSTRTHHCKWLCQATYQNLQFGGRSVGHDPVLSNFMAQKIGSVSCLTFHPYQVMLAAGAADACVSIYADDISPPR
ncbi:Regulatory-associated protein of TOR [Orobanche hederae]